MGLKDRGELAWAILCVECSGEEYDDTNHSGYVQGCVTADKSEPVGESDGAQDARFDAGTWGECGRAQFWKDQR